MMLRAAARCSVFAALSALAVQAAPAAASPAADAPEREVRYTGPLVTGAPPMPQGAFNIEPYLVYTEVTGVYDAQGHRRGVRGVSDDWRLLLPVAYGVTDRLTIGATLRGIYARTGLSGRRLAFGDTSLWAQYQLWQGAGPQRPVLALGLRQNMPTGRHDQLDSHGLVSATGTGAAATTLGLYGQAYFLPERQLRGRFNLFYRFGDAGTRVEGRSCFGTPADWRGRAHLGEAWQLNLGTEYSLSPQWVLAGDLVYEHEQGTRLSARPGSAGAAVPPSVRGASSWRVSVAPAVEYHWSRKAGLIFGAVVSLDGRNSAEIFSPQVAVNLGF